MQRFKRHTWNSQIDYLARLLSKRQFHACDMRSIRVNCMNNWKDHSNFGEQAREKFEAKVYFRSSFFSKSVVNSNEIYFKTYFPYSFDTMSVYWATKTRVWNGNLIRNRQQTVTGTCSASYFVQAECWTTAFIVSTKPVATQLQVEISKTPWMVGNYLTATSSIKKPFKWTANPHHACKMCFTLIKTFAWLVHMGPIYFEWISFEFS